MEYSCYVCIEETYFYVRTQSSSQKYLPLLDLRSFANKKNKGALVVLDCFLAQSLQSGRIFCLFSVDVQIKFIIVVQNTALWLWIQTNTVLGLKSTHFLTIPLHDLIYCWFLAQCSAISVIAVLLRGSRPSFWVHTAEPRFYRWPR